MKELEGKVAFCCVTSTVAKTFRIMGLLKASAIYDTVLEEIQAVSESEG